MRVRHFHVRPNIPEELAPLREIARQPLVRLELGGGAALHPPEPATTGRRRTRTLP